MADADMKSKLDGIFDDKKKRRPDSGKLRKNLLVGTRPQVSGTKILMTGAEGFDGYEIMEYKGMVWGISVRAKDMGQDCMMGCAHITGGELSSYTQLGNESRQKAVERLLEMAARQKANAVINVRFDLSGASHGASEVVALGTGVVIEPIHDFVPTGAVGNVLLGMLEHMQAGESDEPNES